MKRVEFIKATREGVIYVGRRLRKADAEEVAAQGVAPEYAVEASFRGSDEAYIGIIEGIPSMVIGVAQPLLSEYAVVWALGTDECTRSPREMLYHGKWMVRFLLERYPKMNNYCLASYRPTCRWLERIGFTLGEPEPRGLKKELFRRLSIERKD